MHAFSVLGRALRRTIHRPKGIKALAALSNLNENPLLATIDAGVRLPAELPDNRVSEAVECGVPEA